MANLKNITFSNKCSNKSAKKRAKGDLINAFFTRTNDEVYV